MGIEYLPNGKSVYVAWDKDEKGALGYNMPVPCQCPFCKFEIKVFFNIDDSPEVGYLKLRLTGEESLKLQHIKSEVDRSKSGDPKDWIYHPKINLFS
jgi:hypothetical protein